MEGDGEELTAQETALYDRQIRVWGADAQRRLSKAHVLVYGMKGTVAEFCKNIVLAGVGSLTLVDDRVATEEALSSNFLIPPVEDVYGGKTLAELCCNSLKDFNPMVRVSVDKGDLSSFGVEFFSKFDVVVVSCCSLSAKKLANDKCRKLSKRVAFYAVDCRDSCGEVFVDLQDYKYSKKKQDETVECDLKYPSFEDALSVPWRSLPKRMSKLYFAMRVIEKFEESEGRSAGEVSIADLSAVLKLKKDLCTAQSLNESHVPDTLLERLVTNATEFPPVCALIGGILGQFEESEGRSAGEVSIADLSAVLKLKKDLCTAQSLNESHVPDTLLERLVTNATEFPPVCALIGGILGQEVIKAISGKGDPLKNFFFFDVFDGKGIIEDISAN
ncbi:ubiquitin-like 1-activating enzyme E1 A [Vigna unguiculata]|uniref:Ubiquitin-like 1-activating enzyme E1A n=1 Tax=Vigna unguiculata TaxID=3917 RepID=A0A4D6L8Z7_VIGUN|nr:ubiquitin-like 1-activating enzyme E1 A [Vigna unguiculata]